MQPIIAIICEYDPFHLGHKRQFELARKQFNDAIIVCIMSGVFTQRGMPALHSPKDRAKAALENGADVILELPVAYSVRDAEHFAKGAVGIAHRLGCVDYLCFGIEGELPQLVKIANELDNPSLKYLQTFKEALSNGNSYAKAQGMALSASLSLTPEELNRPNNILGISYLRALNWLNSSIKPLPVKREGNYHDTNLANVPYPSATAVRSAFFSGEHNLANDACGYILPKEPICKRTSLDTVLLHILRNSTVESLSLLPYCNEGLEYRLKNCAKEAISREDLLEKLKTKRYVRSRLSRLCTHALLGITQETLDKYPLPPYVRLLGFKKSSSWVLSKLSKNMPFYAKPTLVPNDEVLFQLDIKAYDLWALGAGLPQGLIFREQTVIV